MKHDELCKICCEATGRAGRGDDSIYVELLGDLFGYKEGDEVGPLCGSCVQSMHQLGLAEDI